MKKIEEKAQYYELRAQGKKQQECADILNVSIRTCRRWEKEAKGDVEANAENAKKAYAAKLEEKKNAANVYKKLWQAVESIDIEKLPDDKKLDFVLKYGRRQDEIEKALPKKIKVKKISAEELDGAEAQHELFTTAVEIFNKANSGIITQEEAKQALKMLDDVRKHNTARTDEEYTEIYQGEGLDEI